MSDANGQRQAVFTLSPPWLQEFVGERFLYVPGLGADAILEKMHQGVLDRCPLSADESALPFIGADRVIPRGPSEPAASYRVRLQHALEDWQRAGSARAEMRQLIGYLTPAGPAMRVVKNTLYHSVQSSVWDSYAANADTTQPPTHQLVASLNWDWDGAILKWRVWLVIYSIAGVPWSDEGTWGDGQRWGDGGTWGSTATPDQIAALRSILKTWKSAGSWFIGGGGIIVSFSSALFDPAQPAGGGINPDGHWGHFGKDVGGGVWGPARFSNAIYIDGPPP